MMFLQLNIQIYFKFSFFSLGIIAINLAFPQLLKQKEINFYIRSPFSFKVCKGFLEI